MPNQATQVYYKANRKTITKNQSLKNLTPISSLLNCTKQWKS